MTISGSESGGEILFVHSSLRLGGAEQLRVTVLEELRRRSIPCRVCVFRDSGELLDRIRRLGIPVDVLNVSGKIYSLLTTLKLTSYLRRIRPRIIHGGQFLTNLHTTAASLLARIGPVIIEEHGHYHWKRWYHRFLDRVVCARADSVLCCSHSVKRFAQRGLRLPENRFWVQHNCIDLQSLQGANEIARHRIRKEFGIPHDAIVYGTVSTLRREKGHHVLLDAWRSALQATSRPARLLIVGDGPLRDELKNASADMDSVIWVGQRPNPAEFLAAMDVFVFPSVNEGLGIALLEAMATGLPIIASNCGGIPEVVDASDLVAPENREVLSHAITKMASNNERLCRRFPNDEDLQDSRFHPKRYVNGLLDLHRNLISPGTAP